MNAKLKAIAEKAAENLQAYVKEYEDKILEAWNSVEAESQEQDTKPKFKLGFAITLDLEKDQMETALSWNVKYKASSTNEIPDPDQAKLSLNE